MIDDALLNLDSDIAVTTTRLSTNVISVGTYREIAEGAEIVAVASVTETFAAASNTANVQFNIYWSPYPDSGTASAEIPTGSYLLCSSAIMRRDSLVDGTKFSATLTPVLGNYQDQLLGYAQTPEGALYNGPTLVGARGYIWGQYVVSNGPFTAGKITLGLNINAVHGIHTKNYRSGFTV